MCYQQITTLSFNIIQIRLERTARRPAKKFPYKDPFLRLDVFLQVGKLIEENRYLPEQVRRYDDLGRTFETNILGSSAISSIELENLNAIFVSRFNDWGVEPVRLSALMFFCGRGFITTDGTR